MLKCDVYLIVLNVILMVQCVISGARLCSENVYEYKVECTTENINRTSDNNNPNPVYHHRKIKHLRYIKSSFSLIPNDTFTKYRNLTTLDVSNCKISEINVDTFTNAKNLRRLNLSHNYLNNLTASTFSRAPNLTYIDLSHNQIKIIDSHTFHNGRVIYEINLSHNRLNNLPANLTLNCNILYLNFNNITNVTFHEATKVKNVNFDSNKLEYLRVNEMLKILTVTNNSLTNLTFLINPVNLTYLDLSFNSLNYSAASVRAAFTNLTNLNVLIVKSANLNHSMDVALFSQLHNLRTLDISSNNLSEIDFNLLSHLENLEHLNLSNNNLATQTFCEFNYLFPKLSTIDILQNNWGCANLISVLSKLKQLNISVVSADDRRRSTQGSHIRGIRCDDNLITHAAITNNTTQMIDNHFDVTQNGVYISFTTLIVILLVIVIIICISIALCLVIQKTHTIPAEENRDTDVDSLISGSHHYEKVL